MAYKTQAEIEAEYLALYANSGKHVPIDAWKQTCFDQWDGLDDKIFDKKGKLTCIIRQDPATGIWSILNDATHSPLNVASVTQDANQIRVNYAFTAKKIKSFLAVPDDVLCKTGLQFGGDVGVNYANIIIGAPAPVSAFIASNSSGGLVVTNNIGIDTIGYASNKISITHKKCHNGTMPIVCTTHGLATKFDVVPINVSDTLTEFMLQRRKKTQALVTAASNAFSVSATNSDSGWSVTSWAGGILTLAHPAMDGVDYNIECSSLTAIAQAYDFTPTTMKIRFFDTNPNTQLTTVPDGLFISVKRYDAGPIPNTLTTGDVNFYFSRPSALTGVAVDPSTPMPAGNNIWVFGLFEV